MALMLIIINTLQRYPFRVKPPRRSFHAELKSEELANMADSFSNSRPLNSSLSLAWVAYLRRYPASL